MIGKLFGWLIKGALLFVVLIIVLAFMTSKDSRQVLPETAPAPPAIVAAPAPAPEPAPAIESAPVERIAPGTVGTLELAGEPSVWLAKSEPDYFSMFAAERSYYSKRPDRPAGGGAALYRLAEAKRVKAYALGTRVRVVKDEGAALVVQVLDGDDKGDRGWVQREMFKAIGE